MKWRFWKRKREYPSAALALAELLSPKQIDALIRSQDDRRTLFQSAALVLGQSEEKLLTQIAKRLSIEYLSELPPIPTQHLREFSYDSLLEAGLYPLFTANGLQGWAAVDPFHAPPVVGTSYEGAFYLASWPVLQGAIEESRKLSTSITAPQGQGKNSLVRQVCTLILEEGKTYGAERVALTLNGNQGVYEFRTKEGNLARGEIAPKLMESFEETLFWYAEEKQVLCTVKNGEKYSVRKEGQGRYTLIPSLQLKDSSVEGLITKPQVFEEPQFSPSFERSKKHILLVEDSSTFAYLIRYHLKKMDKYLLTHASDGSEAIALLEESLQPDLIICDVRMSPKGGEEFVEEIKAHPVWRKIPIIMLSTEDEAETQLFFFKRGVHAYISKHENPSVLFGKIEQIFAGVPQ